MTPRRLNNPYVLTLTFDFAMRAEDFAALSPEQIAAVFTGLGHVAALQAHKEDE